MVQALNHTQQQQYYHEQQQPTQEVRQAALAALAASISIVPIAADGKKAPPRGLSWKWLQSTRPNAFVVNRWFADYPQAGFAVLGGKVSGNLEILDFDKAEEWSRFCLAAKAIPDRKLYGLIARITAGYMERSPKGVHLLYRCETPVVGNLKLARAYKLDRQGQPVLAENGSRQLEVLIETRGEGGYVIVAPSAGRVHSSGKPYTRLYGSFESIVTISADERAELLDLARSLDRLPKEERPKAGKEKREFETVHGDGSRPGDDFNARATWDDVLRPAGWTMLRRRGLTEYWQRPGKSRGEGWSATVNYRGRDLLRVFTSSTTFEEKAYTKFAAYAVLNHNGNFSAAAADLASRGYGSHETTEKKEAGGATEPAAEGDTKTGNIQGRRRKTRHVELDENSMAENDAPKISIEETRQVLTETASARYFSGNQTLGRTAFINPKLSKTEVLAVSSQPGTGKGYAFNAEATRQAERNHKNTTAWFTGRLDQYGDQDRAGDTWKLVRGREAAKDMEGNPVDFDSPDAVPGPGNCTVEGEAYHQAMAAKGWERESHKYCQMNCPARDNCLDFGYLSKFKKDGRNAVMSFKHLFTTAPRTHKYLTIDEISYHSFVDTRTVSVQDFAQARQYIWNTPMQYIMRAINEMMIKPPLDRPRLSEGELYRELDRVSREVNGGRDLLSLLGAAQAAGNCFSGELWALMAERSAEAASQLPPNIWHVAGAEPGAGGIYDIMLEEVRSALEGLPLPFVGRLELVKEKDKPAELVLYRRNYLPHATASKPTSVLDATGDGALTRLLLTHYANLQPDKELRKSRPIWRMVRPVVRTVAPQVEMPPCVTVIQETNANFSKTALLASLEKDPKKHYWVNYLAAICKYLLPDGKQTLIVCSSLVEKQLAQALLDRGLTEAAGYFYSINHYGNLRGSNAYKDYDRLIEAGMYMPDPQTVIQAGRALYGGDGEELDTEMERVGRLYQYQRQDETNGLKLVGAEDDVLVFKDARLQRLLEIDREDEHLQVAHRIRPLQATTPKEIVLLFAIPVRGLAVDRVVSDGQTLHGRTKRVMEKGIDFAKSVLVRQPGEGGTYFTAFQMHEATGLALGTIYKYWKEMLEAAGFESQPFPCLQPITSGRSGSQKIRHELFIAAPIGSSREIIKTLIIFGEVPNLLPKGWEIATDIKDVNIVAPDLNEPLIENEKGMRPDLQGPMVVRLAVLHRLADEYHAQLEADGRYTQAAALLRERYILLLDEINALVRRHVARPGSRRWRDELSAHRSNR